VYNEISHILSSRIKPNANLEFETFETPQNEEDFVRYEIVWKDPEGACTWWGPPPTMDGDGSSDPNSEGKGDVILMYDKESRKMVPLPAGFVAPAHVENLWD